jgi:hypothetical protein
MFLTIAGLPTLLQLAVLDYYFFLFFNNKFIQDHVVVILRLQQ